MKTTTLDRRSFLAAAASAVAASAVKGDGVARKKIAFIGTEVRLHSHAQHFLDRFLLGYAWEGRWRKPDVELASIYIDQFPKNDLSRAAAKRHGVTIYPSIADALTLGSSKLAVDGVVLIGEHGKYPKNEKGQTLYPRYEFFKQIVKVFESSGRSVPLFNDKHLSTDWRKCVEMVEDSRRLHFPFMAGSSLPVTRRFPAIDLAWGTPLAESVCVGYGAVDSYDFHALETAQCMSERRRGGEVGIKSVQAIRDAAIWDKAAERPTTRRLIEAALSRSNNLPVTDGYLTSPISFDWARKSFPKGVGYFIEHRDGFHTTALMLPIHDFNYAGANSETGEILSCQMYLPMPTFSATTADFFNPLIRHVERMFVENRTIYPVERTLLTSGMTLAAVESLYRGGKAVDTPEMEVHYTAPNETFFWRT
jgi:hypothetical protein